MCVGGLLLLPLLLLRLLLNLLLLLVLLLPPCSTLVLLGRGARLLEQLRAPLGPGPLRPVVA